MNWQDEQKKVATGVTGGQEFTGLMGKPCCGDFENCWQPCTPRGKFLGALDAKREWVGLTPEEEDALVEQAREVPAEVPCPDYNKRLLTLANAKLKEKNK